MAIPERLLMRGNEVTLQASSIEEFFKTPLEAKRRAAKQPSEFVRGPIPIPWLVAAARVSPAAAFLGVMLWHLARLRGEPVKVSHKPLERFGFQPKRALRLLRALAAAQLITLGISAGKAPVVRIVCEEAKQGMRGRVRPYGGKEHDE